MTFRQEAHAGNPRSAYKDAVLDLSDAFGNLPADASQVRLRAMWQRRGATEHPQRIAMVTCKATDDTGTRAWWVPLTKEEALELARELMILCREMPDDEPA